VSGGSGEENIVYEETPHKCIK